MSPHPSTGQSTINVGVAAHITGAALGGKRFDPTLTAELRRHSSNGIWLCQDCAKLIDSDEDHFSVALLLEWRATAQRMSNHEVHLGIPLAAQSDGIGWQHRGEPPYRPPLDLRLRDPDGNRLFFFAARDRIPFCGRGNELEALQGWLAEDSAFSWTIVTGVGGSGKSRLALELCLQAIQNGWSAGFISRSSALSAPAQFVHFRADAPTLIVFDYVADAPERAGELVRTLCDLARNGLCSKPVRLLLLEREEDTAAWWTRFVAIHEGPQMNVFRGMNGRRICMAPLRDDAQWEIVQYVAGPIEDCDRDEILSEIKRIDPRGRPLLIALAAQAMKAGRPIFQLSAQGIVNDIVARERLRWRQAAPDRATMRKHENALALATMVGGLKPSQFYMIDSEHHFPFTEESYNSELMRMMSGGANGPDVIMPIEPDAVGEWLVLDLLGQKDPFDTRPRVLLAAAQEIAETSKDAASYWAAFQVRAAADFPADVLGVGLFRPPPSDAPVDAVTAWLIRLSDAIEAFLVRPDEALSLFEAAVVLRHQYEDNSELQLAAGRVYVQYCWGISQVLGFAESFAILDELFDWARQRPDLSHLAFEAARLSDWIGSDRANIGDITSASHLFETLRDAAKCFKELKHPEWEEIAEAAASVGLSMRAFYVRYGIEGSIRALEVTLWSKPTQDGVLDLAEHTGVALMERSGRDLCSEEDAFAELTFRSRARSDAQALAFWAANVGYRIADHAESERRFVDAVRDLIVWMKPRANWPDMSDLIGDVISNQWTTEDFDLGRAPIEALLALLRIATERIGSRSGSAVFDNEYPGLRAELLEAVDASANETWVAEVRQQIADIDRTLG